MMPRGILVSISSLVLAAAAGCDERSVCEDVADCEPGESCQYVHADDGLRCVQLCERDAQCPEGQRCRLGASTCAQCQDLLRICQ